MKINLISLLTVLLLQNYALNVYAQVTTGDPSFLTASESVASVSVEPVSASETVPEVLSATGEPTTTEAITLPETPTTTTQTTTTESIAPAESTATTTTTTESISVPTTEAAPVITSGASSTANTAPSNPFASCHLSNCSGCIGKVGGTWTRKELCLLAKSRK